MNATTAAAGTLGVDVGGAPRRRRAAVWLVLSAVLLAAAFAADPFVQTWIAEQRTPAWERMLGSPEAAHGRLDQLFPLLILLAVLGGLPGGGRRCVGLLAPLLLHLPVLHLLKWGIGRMRPLAELGAYHFAPFSGERYADAFPSGHSALPAIVAIVLALNLPRAGWVFYAWAAVEGLKRLAFNWHFLSDVLAGYLLAALVVWACYRWLGPSAYGRAGPVAGDP